VAEAQLGTFGRAAAIAVEAEGRQLIEVGFGVDGSLLTPGEPIWTLGDLQELKTDYVDRPDANSDGFFDRLERQLAGASPAIFQLYAELFILHVLPVTNVGGEHKVRQVEKVLRMSADPVALPDDVRDALAGGGVFHGGPAFTANRWAQIAYLIQLAIHFKRLSEQRRLDAMAEPLVFREEVNAVPTGQAAQRQALLYLAFPHFYLPIVKLEHRTAIRDGLADRYLLESPDDVDVDLSRIYAALTEAEGAHIDLYSEPWIELWRRSEVVQHAWKVHGSNVRGQDMVPIWHDKQSVSLAASLLRPVDDAVGREELKAFVAEDYRSSGYAARQEKCDEFYAFLKRMHPGDLVVTTSPQGMVHFGTVTGAAEYASSTDGRSNLRRAVDWFDHTCPWSAIPDDIAARLTAQGEVLDLSQHIDALTALAEQRPGPSSPAAVRLPDATPELADRIHVGRSWLQDCVELLRDRRQMIFYGPPGTGKTYIAQELARHITDKENVKLVQFHPAYSYEDFFEGFRPQGESGGQMQGFSLKAGPLRRMVDKAAENPSSAYVLIIDEINRGNLPKIFGELYFLLEYRDQAIDLMYSADSAEPFTLPKNIYVIGTMNTADRSIALVDAALRRRFAFLPQHPSEEPTSGILRRWLTSKDYDTWLADLHDELNSRITDNDFKIGPSYFMREKIATDRTDKSLELMWRTDILPLLEEHHFGDLNVDIVTRYGLPALRKSLATKAGILDDDSDSLEPELDDDDDAAADPD
jgi:5-methylcytosine-specific restriction protein B